MALYPRIPLSTMVQYEPDILNGFYYPADGIDDFISYFQLEYGEMMPIYQEPSLLKEHIRVLGIALKPTIDAWAEALALEYNPLENYDRIEKGDDTTDHGKVTTTTGGSTTTHGRGETITGGHTDTEPTHWVEHQVSADNSTSFYSAEKTITDEDKTVRTYQNEKTQESGTTGVVYNEQKDSESGKTKITHDWRIHGNAGVTTSQQMLEAELSVRRFIFMEEVGRLYADRFLIMLF